MQKYAKLQKFEFNRRALSQCQYSAIKDLFEENYFVRSEVNTGEVLKNFEANSEKSLPFFNFVCEMVGECGTPEVRRQTKGKSAACHVHCPGGWSHPKDTMVTMKMHCTRWERGERGWCLKFENINYRGTR